MYNEVKQKLENFPAFRERSERGIFLAKLALRKLNLEGKFERQEALSYSEMVDFATTFDSYRHAWGDVTRECPELQGTDYSEGEVLAQEKKLSLGYTPGFFGDLKKLGTVNA